MPRFKKKEKQVSKDEEDSFKMFSSSEDDDGDEDGEENAKAKKSLTHVSDLSEILSTSQASLWEASEQGPVLKNLDDAVFRRPTVKLTKKQQEDEEKRRRRDSIKILQAMNKSHEYNKSKNASTSNSQEDLRRLYSTALQLFGNKRITKDNAFSLKLLDCFGHLVKKDLNTDDINTVARALEACTRIFSCRVDLAHSTLRRITNDIIHKNVDNGQVDSAALNGDKEIQETNNVAQDRHIKVSAEAEYVPIEFDFNDPISYCGFDENGDEIIEEDDENKETCQDEGNVGKKKKKIIPSCIETNEYNLSLESEVSKDPEPHALRKFKAQFHDSIKTRKPDDFFFQYEKLVPSYSARIEDPNTLREEMTNLNEEVSFPKTLALTEDLIDLQFYDLKLETDFDPTAHNVWGYERQDSDDEEEKASSITTIKNDTGIENEVDNLPNPDPNENEKYDPNERPDEYPAPLVGHSDISDFMSQRDEINSDDEKEEEGDGISIANIKNLDQLEAYFNKIRATKDKKVDIFRLFSNNMNPSRQTVPKPNDNQDKTTVDPQPLTLKELSIFCNKYKSSWRNNLNLNDINKEDWGNFDSMVPIGSYQEMNDLDFPQSTELSKSVETIKRNGKILQNKGGQATKEHYRYFMDRDRNILEIMKKHPKGFKNINQIKEFLQEENDKEENANNSYHEAEHFGGFESDADGDFEGFEGGVRNKDEYCYDNPWVFGDFPEKNARLIFDRKSGGFVDLANLDSECFEEGSGFTTAHSDMANITKPSIDMHFLKTVIEGILKKRFDKNSPLKDDNYTFDELIIDLWKGDFLENAQEHVSPSMALASFLHVCTDCGFSLERITGVDCGYESEGAINDEEKENDIASAEQKDSSNTSEKGPKIVREILFIRPPLDSDFIPSSF